MEAGWDMNKINKSGGNFKKKEHTSNSILSWLLFIHDRGIGIHRSNRDRNRTLLNHMIFFFSQQPPPLCSIQSQQPTNKHSCIKDLIIPIAAKSSCKSLRRQQIHESEHA
jgi:hypothetical protein